MGSHAAPADHLTLCPQINIVIKHLFHRWLCMGSYIAPADPPPHKTLISQMTVYGISCCTCRSPNIVTTDQHCHKTLISQMTVYGILHCTCRSPNIALADLPTEWQFHRFLLWQLIFHSYSESSSFGRPGPDSSTPIQWWFHRFLLWELTTLRAQHLADQVLSDVTPHIRRQFHRFLLYP